MSGSEFRIVNARVVTENEVFLDTQIAVNDGIITYIGKETKNDSRITTIDAAGRYVIPGFIDMHSDAIEKEIECRPGSLLPVSLALVELDKKLASAGITTIYHSITYSNTHRELVRSLSCADAMVTGIRDLSKRLCVNTKIHARYEITDHTALQTICSGIENGLFDLVSIMDHTPGQGQFNTFEKFSNFYASYNDESKSETIENAISEIIAVKESVGLKHVEKVAKLCKRHNVVLASHDDDTADKIDYIHECGAAITEFPMSWEALDGAKGKGIMVAVGSPNIVRGKSHNGNLSAGEIIKSGYASIVCSDYIPSTMLHALYTIVKEKMLPMCEAVKLFSTNPAKALGLSGHTGSLKAGFDADLVIVDPFFDLPRIMKTFVKGQEVFSTCIK